MRRMIVAVLLVLAGACSSGPAAAPADVPTAAVPSLTAALERPRYLATQERVEVVLENDGRDEVVVESLQLRLPGFAEVAALPRRVRVAGGQRVDVPVPHGTARCDRNPGSGSAAVILVLDEGPATVPLTGSEALLHRFHEDLCRPERVAEAVDLGFSGPWERAGTAPSVTGLLRLQRRSTEEAVTVEAAAGSVLLSLRTTDDDLVQLDLPRGERVAEVAIRLSADRCEPHALAESKKTFLFPLWVQLGEEEPAYLELELGEPGRALLTEILAGCMPTTENAQASPLAATRSTVVMPLNVAWTAIGTTIVPLRS